MTKYVTVQLSELLQVGQEKILEEIFKKFSCCLEKDLEDFLTAKAIRYEKIGYGRTFLMFEENALDNGEIKIMAFFTIAQTSIDLSEVSKKKRRKMLGEHPGREVLKSCPAYLIGQIGRSDDYSHDSLPGKVILNECYEVIRKAHLILGGRLITLECREKMFDSFYAGNGFLKIDDKTNSENLLTLYKKANFE